MANTSPQQTAVAATPSTPAIPVLTQPDQTPLVPAPLYWTTIYRLVVNATICQQIEYDCRDFADNINNKVLRALWVLVENRQIYLNATATTFVPIWEFNERTEKILEKVTWRNLGQAEVLIHPDFQPNWRLANNTCYWAVEMCNKPLETWPSGYP